MHAELVVLQCEYKQCTRANSQMRWNWVKGNGRRRKERLRQREREKK